MKIRQLPTLLCILSIITLSLGCNSKSREKIADVEGTQTPMSHAQNIKMTEGEGYTIVELANPWKEGKTLHTYVLVPSEQELPANLPEGTLVRTPLKRAVVGTSVHTSLLRELGAEDAIAGLCDVGYINLPGIKEDVAKGKVTDCGSSMNPTIETIIDLHPDAILLSPFENSGSYGKLGNLNIPIIELADYMETGPLARAEWIKFYAKLFGREKAAEKIFAKVEKSYNNLKGKIAEKGKGKKLLANQPMGGVWYIPGGESTTGLIIKDSGAEYPWSMDKSSGALSLSFEDVLDKAGDADVWFFSYNQPEELTTADLTRENEKYSLFKAFKEKNIWVCNTAKTTYFEDTPFHPDRLLRDIIIMAHPGLISGAPTYYKKLGN
ncbi:MAG: ABC transporter substrate-binding protein [Clostridium sp.]|nr:ABC transporter substrate-binding protein [Prevotella sp.]MCM1429369.1 ABC transporter substrate-binding protein [Clostridium sp.]MCM1475596.1 ABC transporter substrate-binding protein [Muribaculaceae bacterium]